MRVYLFHIGSQETSQWNVYPAAQNCHQSSVLIVGKWSQYPNYPTYFRQKTEQQLLLEGSVYSDLSICINNLICNKISPPKDFF